MKFSSAYEPGGHEAAAYRLWEKGRVFEADNTSSKPHFSISMPPPNETGTLHVGHALFLTLQDIMARHARQKGYDVLWLPGTDHAALATNAIIEKRLAEQGTNKHEIGREQFIKEVRNFVAGSRETINSQIRALGSSCDWSRARYTLDDALNRCVNEVFVKMFEEGLIYRGHRIVNWDPGLETTVSDDEVVHKEEGTPFYTLQFGPFQISTARPETKFGDKYIVMHPDDARYKNYRDGDTFECEWINGKITATVVKDAAVDPEFGTGVMTITPWHDHTDFEIAERHGLEKVQVIGFDGRLLAIAGEFAGMKIDEARPKIVEKLKAKGLLIGVDENYVHNIAINDRGKGVIEPQIKLQWFVDVNRPALEWKGQKLSLREVMRAVVEDGDIKVIPKRFIKVYYHWIDNLRDWCISRQIWWGHRVPVWYKGEEVYAGVRPPEGGGWEQDPDTLDTWFSSALWTWSTLVDREAAKDYSLSLEQLLKASPDFRAYHPTSVMETGWDILFFWVARMILATTYATGQVPFKNVYLHGLVRTETGKKMSKSDPDSIIDPVGVIDQFGADALRLALVAGTGAGNDQRLGKGQIIAGRNFVNKLWNIARYVDSLDAAAPDSKSLADEWILNKLSITAEQVEKLLKSYRFAEAYENVYHFIWDDLADWYIEASKITPNTGVLREVLKAALILAHPFAPFVTETIWQNLAWNDDLLALQPWPATQKADTNAAKDFETIKKLISEARHLTSVLEVKKPVLGYRDSELLKVNAGLVTRLGRLGGVEESGREEGLRLTSTEEKAWLNIDRAKAAAYVRKLNEQKKDTEQAVKRLEERLKNKNYTKKAPAALVEETRLDLAGQKNMLEKLESEIKTFEKF